MTIALWKSGLMATHKETLTRFSESSLQVAKLLKESGPLTSEDILALENSLLVVQLALAHHEVSHRKASPPRR